MKKKTYYFIWLISVPISILMWGIRGWWIYILVWLSFVIFNEIMYKIEPNIAIGSETKIKSLGG